MKFFTKLLSVLLAVMLLASLVACGKPADENNAPTQSATEPTEAPTEQATTAPTEKPTEAPTAAPTEKPTEAPTAAPTEKPTEKPTEAPTAAPTEKPTEKPTEAPTAAPTEKPTEKPTEPASDAKEKILGKWKGKMPAEAMGAGMGDLGMPMELETDVVIFYEFGKNGKGKMIFDEASMKEFTKEMSWLTLVMMAEAFEMKVDDMLAEMEMTKDEYLEMTVEEMDTESLESAFTYKIKGDKLTLTDEFGAKTIITFAFKDGNLVMKDAEEEGAEDLIAEMFPMTLKRVK